MGIFPRSTRAGHSDCNLPLLSVVLSYHRFLEKRPVDLLLMIGIVILILALLGFGGVIQALSGIAWVLLILAVIVIAWRVITGRRPV